VDNHRTHLMDMMDPMKIENLKKYCLILFSLSLFLGCAQSKSQKKSLSDLDNIKLLALTKIIDLNLVYGYKKKLVINSNPEIMQRIKEKYQVLESSEVLIETDTTGMFLDQKSSDYVKVIEIVGSIDANQDGVLVRVSESVGPEFGQTTAFRIRRSFWGWWDVNKLNSLPF